MRNLFQIGRAFHFFIGQEFMIFQRRDSWMKRFFSDFLRFSTSRRRDYMPPRRAQLPVPQHAADNTIDGTHTIDSNGDLDPTPFREDDNKVNGAIAKLSPFCRNILCRPKRAERENDLFCFSGLPEVCVNVLKPCRYTIVEACCNDNYSKQYLPVLVVYFLAFLIRKGRGSRHYANDPCSFCVTGRRLEDIFGGINTRNTYLLRQGRRRATYSLPEEKQTKTN